MLLSAGESILIGYLERILIVTIVSAAETGLGMIFISGLWLRQDYTT